MLGLPMCYALAYLGKHGIPWIVANFST